MYGIIVAGDRFSLDPPHSSQGGKESAGMCSKVFDPLSVSPKIGISAKLSECSCLEQHRGRYLVSLPDGRINGTLMISVLLVNPLLHLPQTWGRKLRDKDLAIPLS